MKFLTDIQIEPLDYSHCRIGSCGRNAAHEVTAAYSDGTADMVRCCNDCLPQAIMGVAVYDCDLDETLVRGAAGELLAALEWLVAVGHGWSKAGGELLPGEFEDAMREAEAAIANARGAK